MRGLLLLGAAGLVLVPALVLWRSSSSEALIEKRVTPPEAAPLCPWRDPEKDLKVLFPSASGYEVETPAGGGRMGRTRILTEVSGFLGKARRGDTLLIYLSGHGAHADQADYLLPSTLHPFLKPLAAKIIPHLKPGNAESVVAPMIFPMPMVSILTIPDSIGARKFVCGLTRGMITTASASDACLSM